MPEPDLPVVPGYVVLGPDPFGNDRDRLAAIEEGTRHRVALQLMPPLYQGEREAVEAVLARYAQVQHRHLAAPTRLAESTDVLVLPGAEHPTLASVGEADAALGGLGPLLADVAAAVAALHEAGLAHGQLGLDSVAVAAGGEALLVGSGVLAALHELAPREIPAPEPAADVEALRRLVAAVDGGERSAAGPLARAVAALGVGAGVGEVANVLRAVGAGPGEGAALAEGAGLEERAAPAEGAATPKGAPAAEAAAPPEGATPGEAAATPESDGPGDAEAPPEGAAPPEAAATLRSAGPGDAEAPREGAAPGEAAATPESAGPGDAEAPPEGAGPAKVATPAEPVPAVGRMSKKAKNTPEPVARVEPVEAVQPLKPVGPVEPNQETAAAGRVPAGGEQERGSGDEAVSEQRVQPDDETLGEGSRLDEAVTWVRERPWLLAVVAFTVLAVAVGWMLRPGTGDPSSTAAPTVGLEGDGTATPAASEPPPEATSTAGVDLCGPPEPAPETSPPVPEDWITVIDDLYTARSAALVTGQVDVLCDVYDSRSAGLVRDLELDAAYARQDLRPDELTFVVTSATLLGQEGALVTLEITDELKPYNLVNADGTVVAEIPGIPSATWQARLVPDASGQEWRFG